MEISNISGLDSIPTGFTATSNPPPEPARAEENRSKEPPREEGKGEVVNTYA